MLNIIMTTLAYALMAFVTFYPIILVINAIAGAIS